MIQASHRAKLEAAAATVNLSLTRAELTGKAISVAAVVAREASRVASIRSGLAISVAVEVCFVLLVCAEYQILCIHLSG